MNTRTKALLAGGVAVVVLATGGVAVAATATPSTTAGSGHEGKGGGGLRLGRIEHGQFVTKDKAGTQTTHDVVNGTVTSVSGTAIAVKDGTGATTTFTVSSSTKVHVKGQAKGTTSTISAVKTGQDVTVLGTGTGPFAADRVLAH